MTGDSSTRAGVFGSGVRTGFMQRMQQPQLMEVYGLNLWERNESLVVGVGVVRTNRIVRLHGAAPIRMEHIIALGSVSQGELRLRTLVRDWLDLVSHRDAEREHIRIFISPVLMCSCLGVTVI